MSIWRNYQHTKVVRAALNLVCLHETTATDTLLLPVSFLDAYGSHHRAANARNFKELMTLPILGEGHWWSCFRISKDGDQLLWMRLDWALAQQHFRTPPHCQAIHVDILRHSDSGPHMHARKSLHWCSWWLTAINIVSDAAGDCCGFENLLEIDPTICPWKKPIEWSVLSFSYFKQRQMSTTPIFPWHSSCSQIPILSSMSHFSRSQ